MAIWDQKYCSLWRLFSWPVALGIVAIAFGFIYRYGPSRWEHRTPIMPRAVIAAVSYAIFRLYLSFMFLIFVITIKLILQCVP